MHEEDQDQLKGAKNMELLQKKHFFQGHSVIFSVFPEMLQQQIRTKLFGLKCCSLSWIQSLQKYPAIVNVFLVLVGIHKF